MLSTSLQLTIIPCGRKEPFRGEPANCLALYMDMILPNTRGQGEVLALPTLMDNISCHPNTPPDYFGQLTQESLILPVLLDQGAQAWPHQQYLVCENGSGHPLTTHTSTPVKSQQRSFHSIHKAQLNITKYRPCPT